MALQLEPENTEIAGLLALMLLTDARLHARTGLNDELIPLSQQNRALWDRGQIAEGVALHGRCSCRQMQTPGLSVS
jgi:predicted RNA polymerase sigma factor